MNLIYFALSISAFFIGFFIYRKGLNDGLSINSSKKLPPMTIKKPKQTPLSAVEEGINNILAYNGEDQGGE